MELLIVISIIALLMAISMPVINKVKHIATRTACKANLHACAVGIKMYLDDYKNIMPPAAFLPLNAFLPDDPDLKPGICVFMKPYLSSTESLECQADRKGGYFDKYGSSYAYRERMGGENVDKAILTRGYKDYDTHIMWDYDNFHGKRGANGSFNYLYADGHVGDRDNGVVK